MIQRIQTLWLSLTAVIALLTLKFSIYSGNVLDAASGEKKYVELTAVNNFIILILTIAIATAAVISIFLYRDRKTQLRIAIVCLILSVGNLVLYMNQTKKYTEGNYNITALLYIAIPVLIVLAAMGIYKDEKLIKSADRLR